MRKRAAILLAILLAMMARPLQLPAASCILSNAPSADGCKPHCCSNKTCCALANKSSGPIAPPLVQSSDPGPQLLIGFVPGSVFNSVGGTELARPARVAVSVRAHSPPL